MISFLVPVCYDVRTSTGIYISITRFVGFPLNSRYDQHSPSRHVNIQEYKNIAWNDCLLYNLRAVQCEQKRDTF